MQLFIVIIIAAIVITLATIFIRYEPKLDLVCTDERKILFLWYNSFNWMDEFTGRKYIKLFEL